MLKEKTAIGPGLLFTFTFSIIFGYGMLFSPIIATKYIENKGFWGVILAFVLFLPVLYAADKLAMKFPGKSIIEYLPLIFGKVIGKLIGLLYIIFALMVMLVALRFTLELMNTYFLIRTPDIVVAAIILVTTAYTAYHGIEVITRLGSFIFGPVLIIIVIGIFLMFENFQLKAIQPFFNLDFGELAIGTMHLSNIFFPGIILFSVLKYRTSSNKGARDLYKAAGLAAFLIFMIVIISIGVFGAAGSSRYTYPFFELTRITTLPYLPQTFGVIFSVVWFTQMFISICGFYYTVSQGLVELTGVFNYKRFVLFLLPVILIAVNFPPSFAQANQMLDYFRPVGFFMVIVVPMVIWLVSLLRSKRGS